MDRQLKCPNCQSDIPASDVNIKELVAKCQHCHHVFNFTDKNYAVKNRPEIVMPAGIESFSLLSELNIEISWRKSVNSFLTFFTILWNLFLVPFILFAIFSGEIMALVGISLHVLIGVSLLYYTLVCFVNTTYIMVNHYRILVEHKPLRLPFYPNRDIGVHEIDQLYTHEYVASTTNGKPDYAYAVHLKLKDKSDIRLIKGLKNPDQALYIEQEIEDFLKIDDKAVKGEIPR